MTSILEDIFGDALSVRRKRNSTKNLFSSASRVARGVPEVMVKITGFGKSSAHIQSHFDYISRKGNVSLETDTGESLDNREDIEQYFGEWQEKTKTERQRKNRRETLHLVLSMPAHVDPESVRKASRSFAEAVFENHEYAFALHTDSSNPHCHLIIRMTDRDGKRINPQKADLQYWRETFAEKIREQGYEAEASSRRTRGITRKRVKSAIWHMTAENKRSRSYHSGVPASHIREAVLEITGDRPAASRPWEERIRQRQSHIRQASLLAADELEKQFSPENVHLSQNIRDMLSSMPPVQTGREQLKQEFIQCFGEQEEKAASLSSVSGKEITERRPDQPKGPERDFER